MLRAMSQRWSLVALAVVVVACDPPPVGGEGEGEAGEGEGEGDVGGEGEGEVIDVGEGEGEGDVGEGEGDVGEGEGDVGEGEGDVGEGEGEGEGEAGDCPGFLRDRAFLGFCQDRVDDNCAVDVPDAACEENDDASSVQRHHLCRTGDEPCPSTQPGNAAPDWDCTGTPPDGVLAFAHHLDESDPEIREFCVMIYAGAVAGESYVAFTVRNGPDFRGPDNVADDNGARQNNVCSADYGVRKHLFFSNLDEGACDGVRYEHAYGFENCGDHACGAGEDALGYEFPVDEQPLSNGCRKMVKMVPNLAADNARTSAPLVNFFAGSDAELQRKLEVLETAEIACVGIDGPDGAPYRAAEIFGQQATATIQIVPR
jgi:hypothetical protein